MSRFQEITERYKALMRETHDRHIRRIDEINAEAARARLLVIALVIADLLALLLGLLLR